MRVSSIAMRRRLVLAIVVAIAVTLSVLAPILIQPLQSLQIGLSDRVRLAVADLSPEQDSRISVVTIDEATMAKLPYRSPLPQP